MAQACECPWGALNWREQAFETLINRLPSYFEQVKLQTNETVDLAIEKTIHCAKPGLGREQGSGQSRKQSKLHGARGET